MTFKNQHSIIEDIRRRKGIGSGLGGGENEEDLHRAIEHLSEDLYSKDVHFILELIQNAEDNPYTTGKDPQLVFKILPEDPTLTPDTDGALLVINNESGFQEKNVRAICKVGDSTKTKREGYIGEKGIGFKSVFLVTRNPHIFSSGYHFSFQDTPDPEVGFGYIIPYWVPEVPEVVKSYLDQTCILLPFRSGKNTIVQNELQQIAPETILFLSKLKALQICVQDDVVTEVYRVDEHYPKVELHTDGTKLTYWLSEKEIPIQEGIKEEKRDGISSRKVSIAFPIGSESIPANSVYAFLPTSPSLMSGFDFLINADFILSSNREQIQEHRPWNQWLRDSISDVFISGFQEMLQDDEMRINAYSYIPLAKENRSPFFSPVVKSILTDLKDKEIIYTEDGNWVLPENARFAPKEFRKLFWGVPLPSQLQKIKLVASELESGDYRERLKSIGVKDISDKEILGCLKDEEWLTQKEISWFFDLYKYLQNQSWATKDALLNIKIVPADDQVIYKPSDLMGIYLPTEEAKGVVKTHKEAINFAGIKFLESHLYQTIHTDQKLEDWAKTTLILFDLNIPMISQELAIKASQLISEISCSTLIWATEFIVQHLSELAETQKNVVKVNLPLLLSDGVITKQKGWSPSSPLLFPEIFDKQKGWQILFPDANDRKHMTILSNRYLEKVPQEQFDNWEFFFKTVGATQTPYPGIKEWNFWWGMPADASPHMKDWVEGYRNKTSAYTLHDWKAPEWLRNIKNNPGKDDLKHAKALIFWLEGQTENLNRYYWQCEWLKAKLTWFYYSNKYDTEDSELFFLIHNTPWLPTSKGNRRPSEVFLDRPEIKEFFGNSVPYLKIHVSDELTQWLKIRTSATFDEVLDLLKNLAGHLPEDVDAKLVGRLYAFLSERWKPDTKKEFSANSLILVTHPNHRWLKLDEVIWTDRNEVFGDTFGYLETEYEGLRSFFVDKLGAKKDVDDEAYAQAWLNLITANEKQKDPSKIEAALEKIFPVMLKIAKNESQPKWWHTFIGSVKVWTQSDHFAINSTVYIPDDSDLQKAFLKEGVEYAWRPTKDSFSDFMPLYSALGVCSLVDSVDITAQAGGTLLDLEESSLLTEDIKKAICIYLRNQMREAFDELKEKGDLVQLLQTKEFLVETLNLTLSLPSKHTEINNGVAYWDQSKAVLYLSASFSKEQWAIDVPSVIARRIVNGQHSKDLEDFIGRVIGAPSIVIDGIIKKRNWTIPESEQSWIESTLTSSKNIDRQDKDSESDELKSEFSDEKTDELPKQSVNNDVNKKTENKEARTRTHNVSSDATRQGKVDKPSESAQEHTHTDKRRSSRLVSYVYPKDSTTVSENPELSKHRTEIGQKGVDLVMKDEEKQGRDSTDMETVQTNHPGYDIKSVEESGKVRYIEVKSLSGTWDSQSPAHVTKNEYESAREYGESFWLYIVENADSPDCVIRRIKNPAEKIDYYLFDHGWLDVCD